MKFRRRRFELTVFEAGRHRKLIGEDIGEERSPDLFLCLPGLLETHDSFDEFISFIAPNARVMVLDWCGRGDSDWLAAAHDYKMSVYLSDLWHFYTYAMGVMSSWALTGQGEHDATTISKSARIHLVGTSMGGLLAVMLASGKPKMLGSVILNDIGPLLPWSGVFALMTNISAAKSSSMNTLRGPDLAKQLDVDPQLLRAVRQPAHLDLPHENRLSGVDFSDRFAAVTTPILVLRGMESEIVNDSVVKRMFEIHPLTRIHECPESGHPVAYSKTVCEAIRHFIGP